jgi:hypothetical protein
LIILYIPLNNSTIKQIDILLVDFEVLAQQSLDGLVDVVIDLCIIVLLLEAKQVEDVVPLALLLDDVDVVVDQLHEFLLEDLAVLPLVVDDRPDVLLLDLADLVLLEPIVELLDLAEFYVAALLELADLAPALEVEFDVEGLLALGRFDICNEVDRKGSALLDISQCAYDKAAVDMHPCAVGDASVLEVKHLLPYSVAVL